MKLSKIASIFIVLISIITILSYGKHILLPFVLAVIVWLLIKEIKNSLRRIGVFRKFLPAWIQTITASMIMFLGLAVVVKILAVNIETLTENIPLYIKKIEPIKEMVEATLKSEFFSHFDHYTPEFDIQSIITNVLTSFSDLFENAFNILLYAVFLLLEESVFSKKLKAIYPTLDKFKDINHLIKKIKKSISSYLTLKTLVSFLTGFLSYIALLIIGVDAPVFWAFLIFLLNYIPTIGSLVATSFPAIFTLLQFGEFTPFFLVLGTVGIIQLIIGNIVEPKVMGNSLNISSLVVLLALSFWGAVWGITGMVLSVPITVIMIIIFAEFPSTKFIAVMLSEKGQIHT